MGQRDRWGWHGSAPQRHAQPTRRSGLCEFSLGRLSHRRCIGGGGQWSESRADDRPGWPGPPALRRPRFGRGRVVALGCRQKPGIRARRAGPDDHLQPDPDQHHPRSDDRAAHGHFARSSPLPRPVALQPRSGSLRLGPDYLERNGLHRHPRVDCLARAGRTRRGLWQPHPERRRGERCLRPL